MKKILLPTDFSDNSWNAISYALHLFENENCTFYILNTYTPVIYHIEYVLVNPAQFGMGDPIRENALRCLDILSQKIKDNFNNPKHKFESIAAFNTLIPEIREIVKDKNIDMVVMGTKGATGAKEVLFGSNTVHVFKTVDCPILAIPDNFHFEAPLEILFPTDYEVDYSDDQLMHLIALATFYHARINVMHVYHGKELSLKQEQRKQKLEVYLKPVAHLFHKINNENIPEAISNFQTKSNINFLVMINNKHSFFENLFFRPTINQIGFHLNIPFLVVPSKA